MSESQDDNLPEDKLADTGPTGEQASDASVADSIEEIPSADGAMVLQGLSTEKAAQVAEYLDPITAGKILARMTSDRAAEIISEMSAPEASMVLEAMDPDDRVDVIEHVSPEAREELLGEMHPDEAAEVRNLEQYPTDSAGGIMTTDVTALPEDLTIEQAVAELRKLNQELEQVFYVYVVDRRKHLIGVLSMRDLILSEPNRTLAQIMRPNVSAVPAMMDQEEVARLMRKYKYLAMPVVDAKHRLLGIITVDDVVEVISEEAQEDVQKMFGVDPEERLTSPWTFSFRKRLWWLIINLGTAFLAGAVVGAFEKTLESLTLLAIYMPIVAGMGGNASAQAMSVSIRGIAIGTVDRILLRSILLRELIVGLLTGISIGILTAAVCLLWHHNPVLGIVVGLALVINHTFATTSGAGVPFLMKYMGFDPAQSATIIATTITDICGFFSLFALARIFMQLHWL